MSQSAYLYADDDAREWFRSWSDNDLSTAIRNWEQHVASGRTSPPDSPSVQYVEWTKMARAELLSRLLSKV